MASQSRRLNNKIKNGKRPTALKRVNDNSYLN